MLRASRKGDSLGTEYDCAGSGVVTADTPFRVDDLAVRFGSYSGYLVWLLRQILQGSQSLSAG